MKLKISTATWIFIYCCFTLSAGQFVPIYFTNYTFRDFYYVVNFLLLIASSAKVIHEYIYNPLKEKNLLIAALESIFTGFVILVISGLTTFGILLTALSDARTFYFKKDNNDIKIVSTYIDGGAFGGVTSPEDFHIVLRRPLTPFFKMETAIDTTKINKDEWIKFAE